MKKNSQKVLILKCDLTIEHVCYNNNNIYYLLVTCNIITYFNSKSYRYLLTTNKQYYIILTTYRYGTMHFLYYVATCTFFYTMANAISLFYSYNSIVMPRLPSIWWWWWWWRWTWNIWRPLRRNVILRPLKRKIGTLVMLIMLRLII